MKFKMRVMHSTPSESAEAIALSISRAQQTTNDQIPPAYPCENEKLLFIVIEMKGSSAPKTVVDLCKDLNTSRAKNVAFCAIGSAAGVDALKKTVSANGIKVMDTLEITPKGLFKKKIQDSDVNTAVAWAEKIVSSLEA